MAIFESRQRKLFRSIKALSDAGAVDQAATRVEQELKTLIESPEIARELVAYLMDIAYPDLAARAGEEIIRAHRDLAVPIVRLLEERQADFPRSFELLRTLWQVKLRQRDFNGALEVLNKVDRATEARLFESLESSARNADRFAADRLLEGDIDRFISYSLALYRRGRENDALEALLRAAQRSARPDDRIPAVIEWIGTRKGDRAPLAILYLVRVYLAAENVELALRNIPELFDAPEEIVTQAVSTVERDLLPLDLSSRGRIYFARLLAADGRFDAASRELEKLVAEGELGAEVDAAIKDLASRASDSARPLLLLARFKKARGENTAALDALEKSFEKPDASSSPIAEIAGDFLSSGIDRDNSVARQLAALLVENGSVTEAVEALCRMVLPDPEWVQAQIQKLLLKDKNSAEILTLLAVVMLVRGRESESAVTMKHLHERKDRKSREDIVQVLSRFDSLMNSHPGLRRMRAAMRGAAGREGEAASDWFSLMLQGDHIPPEGLREIEQAGLHRSRARELVSSGFKPESPHEYMLTGLAALAVSEYGLAEESLAQASSDSSLVNRIAEQIAILPDDALGRLDLGRLLSIFASSGAAKTVADIILRTKGSQSWRMDLVSKLSWGDRPAEVLFRLRAFLAEGKVALAGAAAADTGIVDPALTGLADFCRLVSEGSVETALKVVAPAVEDRRTSSLAAGVLESILHDAGNSETLVRRMLATAFATDGRARDAVGVLEPVLGMPGVTQMLEDLAASNSGLVEAPLLLVRTAAMEGEPERLRRYAGMALEIDPGRAGEICALCERVGGERQSGQCLFFAAELSDRYHLQSDPETLLTKAVLMDPPIAAQIAGRKNNGPALRALCCLATANSTGFADVMRRRQNLTVPISPPVAEIAVCSWRPETDGEAMTFLAGVLDAGGMEERAIQVLSLLARDGIGAWKTSAGEKLLLAALEGRAPRKVFWDSVRDQTVIQQALDGVMVEGLAESPTDEIASAAGAVLASGVDATRAFEFGRLLLGREGARPRLVEIASYCFERWKKGDRPPEEEFVKMLLAAGMRAEASEVALASGRDDVLGHVMNAIEHHRAESPPTGQARARSLVYAGRFAEAFESLAGSDDDEALDLRAYALWRMGRRNAAISAWLDAYRTTLRPLFIRRVHWALEEAGYALDARAVEKFMESRHPGELARAVSGRRRGGTGLGVISSV